jgi:hypothetical protein
MGSSSDFLPWRFSAAGRRSAWRDRHPGSRKPTQNRTHRAYLFRPLEDGLKRYVLQKWSGEFQFAVSQRSDVALL